MTKRVVRWTSALVLLLAAVLCAAVFASGAVARAFHRPITGVALAAADTSQTLPPRAPDFLQPQRLDSWRIIGPGGGGTFYYPAISPHDPNLIFATTDMTACYVSENGGHTWRTFNLRRTCKFVFDPKLPNRVYALSAGLWRSDDRGHTWSLVSPDGSATVQYVDDEGDPYVYASSGYVPAMSALAVDPDDSNTLYTSQYDLLRMSRDGGKTWKDLTAGIAEQLWIDPTSPADRRTFYTRRGNVIGIWDGSKYATRTVEGIGEVSWAAFGIPSGGGKPVIYIAGGFVLKEGQQPTGGIMASHDGGQTWTSLTEGILKQVAKGKLPNFTMIGASRKHPEVVYVSLNRFVPLTDLTQYYLGVLKSSDGGVTWAPVRLEASTNAANMHNDWLAARFGPDWPEEPVSMAVDDNDPNLVYTGDLGRIMRSTDGGKNWSGVFSQSTGKGYTTTGLDVTTCYGLHFDPFDSKRMFISYTDIGLMRSEDGGESWLSATSTGVPFAMRSNTYWLEFDPAVKGKMWAVMSGKHDLPRNRMLNLYGGGSGGVTLSVDGGHSWTVSSHGLPSTIAPTHILLDPKSPAAARVLYVAGFGLGVFKSTDGGQNWVRKSNGLPENAPLTWRMAMDSEGTLYVVTIRRSTDGKYGNDQDGWLFRSRNGAESWERVPLPEGVNGPVGITPDPRDPTRLYLSAWARYTLYAAGTPPPAGGVYMSADGGRNWQNVLNASRRIYDVTVDPRNSDVVYATGFEAAAWRSADRGKTWGRIGGFNFRLGHRVIPDPTDINKIYITTFGNSVWHGPATGDPKAVEDIVGPPAMMFQSAKK